MNIYDKNVQWFIDNYSDFEWLKTPENGTFSGLKFEEDGNNYLVSLDDVRCYLHSVYSIEAEFDWMFSEIHKADIIILFGFGNGSAIEYIFKKYPSIQRIVVVEPSLELFREVLARVDVTGILRGRTEKVVFAVGESYHSAASTALQWLDLSEDVSIFFVDHVSYRSLFSDYYQDFLRKALDQMRTFRINIRTIQAFLVSTLKNVVQNLAHPAYAFENFSELLRDKPVIIVSAGPSLMKNIHLLEQAKEKAIVIAVGSSVKILEKYGVKPHFRMGVDPSVVEKKLFDGLKDTDIPLLFTNALYSEIVDEYKGPVIRTTCITDPIGIYICRTAKLNPVPISSGTSVANFAAFACCQMQCKKLIFIGQDMCAYDKELYSDDSGRRVQDGWEVYHKKDIYGNDVVSPANFYSIKVALDEAARVYKDSVHFINATEGGLGIEGVENIPLQEVLDALPVSDSIEKAIDNVLHDCEQVDLMPYLTDMAAEVNKCFRLIEKSYSELKKVKDITKFKTGRDKQVAISVFKKAQKYDKKLRETKLYSETIQGTMETLFTIYHDFWDRGLSGSEEEQLKSIRNIMLRKTKDLHAYLKRLQQVITELVEKPEETESNS